MNITYRTIKGTSYEGNLCCQPKIDVIKNEGWYFSGIYQCTMPALYLGSDQNISDFPICRQCLEELIGYVK